MDLWVWKKYFYVKYTASIVIYRFMFAKVVSMVSATVVLFVVSPLKNKPTAKPNKNIVKPTRDWKVTARLKSDDGHIKIKIIQKPWMIGVQQHPVAILSYMKLL